MSISSFLKLVEIQTKVASIIPFLFGSFYVYYRFDTFSMVNALILFISMIIFDMTTTTINKEDSKSIMAIKITTWRGSNPSRTIVLCVS